MIPSHLALLVVVVVVACMAPSSVMAFVPTTTPKHPYHHMHRRPAVSSPYSSSSSSLSAAQLIIAGAPASGKGTQCEVLQQELGVVHLSTGDMLRAAVAAQTPVGKVAQEYMNAGKLVPDDVIIGVVKDRLNQADCQEQGFLLDGFPRTQAQAQALQEAGIAPDCFLFLNVPDDILVERVVGRRTDPATGKIYHLTFSPPPPDVDVDTLIHRSDDTKEKVQVRLEQFHEHVNAVKDSYKDVLVVIDGNQPPHVVSQELLAAIQSKMEAVA